MQFKSYKLKAKRKTALMLFLGIIFTMPFQNCIQQGGFSSGDSSSGTSLSSTSQSQSGGTTAPPPTTTTPPVTTPPPPPPPPGAVLTPEQKQALCLSLVAAPTMQGLPSTELTLKVGMGAEISGDAKSAQMTVTANTGITDKAQFDANTCASLFSFQLRCEVVTGDAARPINITQALNIDGINLAVGADDKVKSDIAKNVFKMDDCATNFNYSNTLASGINSTRSQLVSNSNDDAGTRCTAGSFYIRYTVRNGVGMNNNKTSGAQYVKVNLVSGCWDEAKLTSEGITQNSQYGSATAVDGNIAAVVAQTDPSGAMTKVGSVSIFEKVGSVWSFKQKIVLPGAASNDAIQSVALKGTTLFIGTPYRGGTGAVFQYEKNGQSFVYVSEVAKPLSGNSMLDSQEQYFGYSLAFNGSKLAIGAPHYSDLTQQRMGQVYVYDVGGGVSNYVQTLQHTDSVKTFKGFGMSLAMSGSYLAVGAPQAITKEQNGKGDVIIFNLAGATYASVKKLTAGSINNAAKFGYAVAMNGTKLIVGAPGFDKGNPTDSPNSGGVYYFPDFNTAAPGTPNYSGNREEWMGVSVALNDQGLFFSNPYGNSRAGMVNFYKYSALGTVSFRLFGLDTVNNDAFGWGLAVSGSNVVVGARVKNNPEATAGGAYAFLMK